MALARIYAYDGSVCMGSNVIVIAACLVQVGSSMRRVVMVCTRLHVEMHVHGDTRCTNMRACLLYRTRYTSLHTRLSALTIVQA